MYKKEEEQLQLGRSEQRVVYINVALTFLAPPPLFSFFLRWISFSFLPSFFLFLEFSFIYIS